MVSKRSHLILKLKMSEWNLTEQQVSADDTALTMNVDDPGSSLPRSPSPFTTLSSEYAQPLPTPLNLLPIDDLTVSKEACMMYARVEKKTMR